MTEQKRKAYFPKEKVASLMQELKEVNIWESAVYTMIENAICDSIKDVTKLRHAKTRVLVMINRELFNHYPVERYTYDLEYFEKIIAQELECVSATIGIDRLYDVSLASWAASTGSACIVISF